MILTTYTYSFEYLMYTFIVFVFPKSANTPFQFMATLSTDTFSLQILFTVYLQLRSSYLRVRSKYEFAIIMFERLSANSDALAASTLKE